MSDTFEVHLTPTVDAPNGMNFRDTYQGLDNVWYKFQSDAQGNVTLLTNADGFEHLARYFLKMARTNKMRGYHGHHGLEFGAGESGPPELTIGIVDAPAVG